MIAHLSRAHGAVLSFVAFASLALLGSSEASAALTLSGQPTVGIKSGQTYSWAPTVSGTTRTVNFKVVNKPAWLTFSTSTGRLSGVAPAVSPSTADYQKYAYITISASDGATTAKLAPFTIFVVNAALAPKISGTPAATATVGKAYSFQPTASDPDGDPLTFSVANKPAWATFDTKTGRLYGTPSVAATHSSITIKVSDGTSSASLPAFSIKVSTATTTTNTAPTISGAPSLTAYVGQVYSFQPTASDAERDPLTFSIVNKPSWATFNTSTGQLSGTPGAAGTFANITISVSDGKASKSLAPFSVTVLSPTIKGAATLTWVAPTTDISGAPLNGLAGFRVRYGSSPTALTNVIQLPNATTTSVTIEELPAGTHYFAVTAYMVNGLESDPSQVVYKTIM